MNQLGEKNKDSVTLHMLFDVSKEIDFDRALTNGTPSRQRNFC
jgi:hypothetical protein